MQEAIPYTPKNKIRIVTAASLFDGHDAAINIMRRIIQSTGCEVIHLGHDRSVEEVVNTAIQEDAQAIAMTSYQGGHTEYFKYMFDLLKEKRYKVVLATNPLFPMVANHHRIRWAGFEPSEFEYISSFESNYSCKPHLEYYNEVLENINKEAENCYICLLYTSDAADE